MKKNLSKLLAVLIFAVMFTNTSFVDSTHPHEGDAPRPMTITHDQLM
ncbi:hypothetical protein [Evansella halocellulosilytica]|nr:hypothetical protein [Evansella halocellulosilytica]